MDRRYRIDLYRHRIESIKAVMPHCCIGVDVIVGFPGETEKDFLQTYRFLNELEVSYLHVFTYSERPNTKAVEMEGVVPKNERAERSKMLRILSEKKKIHFYQQNLGREATVLFENDIEEGKIHGFTENYVRVAVDQDPSLLNQLKTVKLDFVNEKGLCEASIKVPAEPVM